MKRTLFALVIATFCVTQVFGAMLGAGTRTLSVAGSVNQTDELNIALSGMGGYFIMDNVEVGCQAGVGWLGGGDLLTVGVGVFGEYNLVLAEGSPIVPYAGAGAGVEYRKADGDFGDDADFAIEIQGYGGSKFYLVENLAIGAELRVMFATEDIYFGDGEMEAFDIMGLIRTSFYF